MTNCEICNNNINKNYNLNVCKYDELTIPTMDTKFTCSKICLDKLIQDLTHVEYSFCSYCHMSKNKLYICSHCNIAKYCSIYCQKEHWKQHKNTCVNCNIHLVKKYTCGKCRKTKYCSVDCQQEHWKEHKLICCT